MVHSFLRSRISGGFFALVVSVSGLSVTVSPDAAAQPPAAAPAPVQSERFDVERYAVEGNTLLKPEEIEAAVRPFTGKAREYGDVQRALEALETLYRARGYSAVQVNVPEQELSRGVVTLQVVEAAIRRVSVQGNSAFSEQNIRRSLPALQEGSFPNATALSANVQLANENPAKQVDVVLKGTESEGLVDADVNVTDSRPIKLTATYDNTGNDATGQHRLGVGLVHANLFDRDHVASLNYITSPEESSKVSIYSLGYRIPLYRWGDSIDLIYAKSDVDAGTTQTVAGPLAFAGKGDIYGLRYNWLLPRQGEYSQRLVFGLDLKAFQNACTVGGTVCPGGSGTDVTVRPWSLTYSGQWAGAGHTTDFYAGYNMNWKGAGHGNAADIAAARPGIPGGDVANPDYQVVKAGVSHSRALPGDWQMRAAVTGQYSRDALISGEQFSIAGATAVRGFAERDIARDKGFFGNLELYTPNLAPRMKLENHVVRVLAFYDTGLAANNPLQGEASQKVSVSSVGVGLRWSWKKNLALRWDFARVYDEGGSRTQGDQRSQFLLSLTY